VVCRTAPALRCVSRGYGCRRSQHSGFVLRSHQNCKGAEFGFARETRRSHLRGVPSPKSERVRRKWISSTFLVTCLQRPDYFNDLNCRVVGPRFRGFVFVIDLLAANCPASVSSVRQLLSWSRSNHTVYGDLESRWFTAVISNRLIAQTRYQHGTPQDTSDRNFVPKRDLTR
jgi:hypothetical protein